MIVAETLSRGHGQEMLQIQQNKLNRHMGSAEFH